METAKKRTLNPLSVIAIAVVVGEPACAVPLATPPLPGVPENRRRRWSVIKSNYLSYVGLTRPQSYSSPLG